ncbi:hypothetical protein [Tsuneonella dongtanensis]|nr:hypothetical protein [Tsuneonella dongtanensis]
MADASAQPQVVATIVPNMWSTIHLDIEVSNTGNATAFDVEVSFDPPLENGEARMGETPIPFQRISVLKPGQSLRSYLSDVGNYLDKSFTVSAKWKLHPDDVEYQTLGYWLNMGDYKGVSYLGARDPLTQLADQVKKLREDWRRVASGSSKLKADVYSSADRERERAALEERWSRERESRSSGDDVA